MSTLPPLENEMCFFRFRNPPGYEFFADLSDFLHCEFMLPLSYDVIDKQKFKRKIPDTECDWFYLVTKNKITMTEKEKDDVPDVNYLTISTLPYKYFLIFFLDLIKPPLNNYHVCIVKDFPKWSAMTVSAYCDLTPEWYRILCNPPSHFLFDIAKRPKKTERDENDCYAANAKNGFAIVRVKSLIYDENLFTRFFKPATLCRDEYFHVIISCKDSFYVLNFS